MSVMFPGYLPFLSSAETGGPLTAANCSSGGIVMDGHIDIGTVVAPRRFIW